MKNLLLQFFVYLFRGRQRHASEKGRFLIVSTTGLGDTLWGTPAIRNLRQKNPGAYIGVLTSPLGASVLKHNPHIDEIFIYKKLFRLWRILRKKEIATVLIFHTSQRSVLPFCALLGASRIVGTEGLSKGLDSLLTEIKPARSIHEIERRIEIAGAPGSAMMELFPSSQDVAATPLSTLRPLVCIHPGAKDRFKQWPPSHFVAVAKALQDHLGCQICVTGNAEEKQLVGSIAKQISGAKAFAGNLTILQLAALMQKMSLVITNDTGPMHIACAMQVPVVALFTPTDSRLCGPYLYPSSKIIQKSTTCSPCLRKKCREPFCLRQISVEEVTKAALELFYARARR
ncbi:MAG: glycosyltransferase family 9 protein [Verrucomicrobia bacterium]|nr:glycosyltransferase family 9 protein [Verrucomicrobiota bacterium]